ncbi:O-fucosyltransferase family protein [Sediminicola luteus]|uniref:Glycosyl transferase family 11 n=1 Tax=Sediminicola luteus TaxID=319238 RepID=A0ABV2TXS7_9FLAO
MEGIDHLKRKIWEKLVRRTKQSKLYFCIYKSYWHLMLRGDLDREDNLNYFTALPNSGAGIGHQMANWIAGLWFAKKLDLRFAHSPFPNPIWEYFLGFGEEEITADVLIKNHGYKKIKLPLFDENKKDEIALIKNIINSYQNKKVVFFAEQDQYYGDQFGVMVTLKQKFHNAKARQFDHVIYSKDHFNIAIHVRRGDITIGQLNKNPNLLMRWQDNDFFTNALDNAIKKVSSEKPIRIFLFSQGNIEDFKEFEKYKCITYCLDMNAKDSFLHMVYADMLITSKSSFSYKPALLNKGIIVSAKNFWHGYPKDENWLLTDDKGFFI